MNILVIGGGGREHALVWKIAQSPLVEKIWCAPGNPGIASLAECVPLTVEDLDGLLAFARQQGIDLTVVGPEIPLTLGIVDRFQAAGLTIFGPSQSAARLEGSKAFCKDLMDRCGIPTAAYGAFTDRDAAIDFIRRNGAPIVVKADGLAAGKGVVVAGTEEEAIAAVDESMLAGVFGEAGKTVVIEEFLEGEEASFLAFTDGQRILPLASAQDHKPVFDDDQGPNTGGMGAYSPAPVVTEALHDEIVRNVLEPLVAGMEQAGCPYRGILYAGLMIKDGDIKVLEFNARFGDPEAQPLLARLQSDLVPVLLACARGDLAGMGLQWHDKAAVCVVMASGGYPGPFEKGFAIDGLDSAAKIDDLLVFHAGTAEKAGKIVNNGGRVLGVTGLGATVADAIDKAYRGVKTISWSGAHYRTDIGKKALGR
ncbi:MAG: phosphoribosylamine--glycine ligase [Desulfuromonadales bacterium]|jgi:phosphoribosylamine--glycine ligase